MGGITYPLRNEQLIANDDMTPKPFSKMARRLAQLDRDKAHRITMWFEDGKPRYTIETLPKIEGG